MASRLTGRLAQPPASALASEVVVAPSQGMARWLQLNIADRLGVCANVRFPLPAAFIWDMFRAVVPALPETSRHTPSVATWRIMQLLSALPGDKRFAPLAAYLKDQDDRNRYELSRRIAEVFDQYLLFRPDWIREWERSGGSDWQAALWQLLATEQKPAHWVHAQDAFFGRCAAGAEWPFITELPQRVFLFGLPALSPAYVDVIERLAQGIEMHLYLLNPCRQYWGDIVTGREQSRLAGGARPEALYLETGNPLLASLGKPAREFIDRIVELGGEEEDDFESPPADSLLHLVQADILDLRDRGRGDVPVAVVDPGDDSIQIHACHSAMREVEILHDRLLDMFEAETRQGRTLHPSDILVVAPDMAAYTPYVAGVFGAAKGGRHIPYLIAAGGTLSQALLSETLIGLLALPDSRLTAEAVLAPLETPAVQRRFGLDDEALARLRRWVSETGIRWALDAAQRGRMGLPATAANTWQAGLDRMLLGYAMPGHDGHDGHDGKDDRLFGGVLPYDEVEGMQAATLAGFLAYLEVLLDARERLGRSRPLADWTATMTALVGAFFQVDEAEEEMVKALCDVFVAIARDARLADARQPVSPGVFGAELQHRLEQVQLRGMNLGGGVCFSEMAPARGLPFEVVCLLGMNDGAYPRLDRRPDFDRMATDRRRGDRSRREEDRQVFLELLLAARRRLYISYVGNDIRGNEPLPPSVLVSELLDTLNRGFTPAREKDAGTPETMARRIVVRHPLQAFSPRYFMADDTRLFSYREDLCVPPPAAVDGRPPLLGAPLPLAEDEFREIDLRELIDFLRNPARFLLRRRLAIDLYETTEELGSDEPFAMEGFTGNDLQQRLTDALLEGRLPATMREIETALGELPHGAVGARIFQDAEAIAQRFAARLRRDRLAESRLPVDLHIDGTHISGTLEGVTARGLQRHLAREKAYPALWLECWVRHLVLNALRPEQENQSTLFLLDGAHELRPVEDAQAMLGRLLTLFREGLALPLHFFPRSASAYLKAQSKGKDPRLEARLEWEGIEKKIGEGAEPYYRLAFGDSDPLDARFEALAQAVFGPLNEHLGDGQ